jgi:hypothetical protein
MIFGYDLCTKEYGIRPFCPLCWRLMANGPIEGTFRCRHCGTVHVAKGVKEQLHRSSKGQVLAEILKRKAVKVRTLQRRFPLLPVQDIVKELEREGRVAIQQSGFAGHNLFHGKLVVLR